MGSGVGASVGWVEEDEGAGGGLLCLGGSAGEQGEEECGEMSAGRGQGRRVDCTGWLFEVSAVKLSLITHPF